MFLCWGRAFASWLMHKRPADFIIWNKAGAYLHRWHVIPPNRFFNIYLHLIVGNDSDRALHDHPWPFWTWVLMGRYLEIMPGRRRIVAQGDFLYRPATHTHRIELSAGSRRCVTLFITGPHTRQWGFYTDNGWVDWRTYTDARDRGRSPS